MAQRNAARKVREALPGSRGISPNPHTNLLLADVVLRTGGYLFRRTVQKGLLGAKYDKAKARQIVKGRSMGESLLGFMIARAAVGSVPGAILVGGGLLAKTLYDRKNADQSRLEGEMELERMAEDGMNEDGWITDIPD